MVNNAAINKGAAESKAVNASRALDLRIQGLSYRRIGKVLGVSQTAAHRYVTEEIGKVVEECSDKADTLRQMEIERLDDALLRVVNSEAYKQGDAKAVAAAVRVCESRRKLLGLDAPTRQDVTSGGDKVHFNIRMPSDEQ